MLDMRWKLLLTPVCRDVPDSVVLKNTLRGSNFSHAFSRVTRKWSIGLWRFLLGSIIWTSWIRRHWALRIWSHQVPLIISLSVHSQKEQHWVGQLKVYVRSDLESNLSSRGDRRRHMFVLKTLCKWFWCSGQEFLLLRNLWSQFEI